MKVPQDPSAGITVIVTVLLIVNVAGLPGQRTSIGKSYVTVT
jgi:hypothetical protein